MYEAISYPRVPRLQTFSKPSEICRGLVCRSDSMTDQQFARMSKVTSILERYKRTGLMPHKVQPPVPFERQTAPDLNDYQALVEAVDEMKRSAVSEATAPAVEPQNGATAASAAEKETVSDGTTE